MTLIFPSFGELVVYTQCLCLNPNREISCLLLEANLKLKKKKGGREWYAMESKKMTRPNSSLESTRLVAKQIQRVCLVLFILSPRALEMVSF